MVESGINFTQLDMGLTNDDRSGNGNYTKTEH